MCLLDILGLISCVRSYYLTNEKVAYKGSLAIEWVAKDNLENKIKFVQVNTLKLLKSIQAQYPDSHCTANEWALDAIKELRKY